jgi:prepilin signal peptidase PulO-like enzyme (type II secretory pathway)
MSKAEQKGVAGAWIASALAFCYLILLWIFVWLMSERTPVALGLVPPLLWLSVVDLQRREIPDIASFVVASIGILVWWRNDVALLVNLVVAVSVIVALALVGDHVWRRSRRDPLGLGDVKLIGAGVLVVGAEATWLMLLLASLGGITAALIGKRSAAAGVPFGPFLAYAICVTYLIAGPFP